jgi:hypothetical protein
MKIDVLPFPLGCGFADLQESWRAAEEAGFHTLWAIDHATPTPDLTPSWEGSSLLVAMAARTRSIPIGVLVFDVLLRHPFVLAGSIAVAQSVSGGTPPGRPRDRRQVQPPRPPDTRRSVSFVRRTGPRPGQMLPSPTRSVAWRGGH